MFIKLSQYSFDMLRIAQIQEDLGFNKKLINLHGYNIFFLTHEEVNLTVIR